MKPIATIGVCVRNCEISVKEAIESILAQDFPDNSMEIIFVDDGSEDNTLPILKYYVSGMNKQTKLYSGTRRGLGATRNVVVDNASGDYIIWVDGDMRLTKDFVKKQVEFMEKNSAVGVAKGRYGINHKVNLVAYLENCAWTVDSFRYGGKSTSELPGTGGSIYRVKTIRQVGGFDNNIKAAGEDIDAEFRIRRAGWKLYFATEAEFFEKRKETWKSLWSKYFWHGYGLHLVLHKNKGIIRTYRMIPPAAIINGLLHSVIAYRLTRRKAVFLLPFHYVFKMTAWCLGFVTSHRNSYGHVHQGF